MSNDVPAGTSTQDGPQPVAAIVVRRGDSDGRRAVAKLAQARGWRVSTVYEIGGEVQQKKIVADAHSGAFSMLAIPCLSVLGTTPAAALGVVAVFTDLNIGVESVEEGWLAVSQQAVGHVGQWLDAELRRSRAAKVRAAVAASGRRPGRPRRDLPPEAEGLVEGGMPVGRAARLLGVPESSLRRLLKEKAQERRLVGLTVEAA